MPALPAFAGSPPEAFDFSAWFDANRDVYERAVRIPMEALLARADNEAWGNGKGVPPQP